MSILEISALLTNTFMKKLSLLILVAGLAGIFGFWQTSQAYQIQDLPGALAEGDIVLGPTKIELFLDIGEKAIKEITVTNRTGRTVNFTVGIEDFKGSRDPNQTLIFMGEEKGPYSLKDWVKPEIKEFTLNQGQRIILPVEIAIPAVAEPGGYYGTVFILGSLGGSAAGTSEEKVDDQIAIASRVGTLFFVRVKGEVQENGGLEDFKTTKNFYEKGPIPFELLFENNGSVHLTPYGVVEIKNLFGGKVAEIQLDPWFALPDSQRLREVNWEKKFLFGRYTALALVNRGYQDIIDQKSLSFWVIPWKIFLGGLAGLILIVSFLYWIISHFEIRKKQRKSIVNS